MIKRTIVSLSLLGLALSASAWAAAKLDIDQVGQKFSQTSASIAKGDSISWHNHDDVTHNINVIDASDNSDDQGLQKPGQDLSKTFDEAGHFEVRCAIHPRMKMTVDVR